MFNTYKTIDEVVGVIEIASFKAIKEYEIVFIEKIVENLAIVIINFQKNALTKKLLEESTIASENLKAQEEEMRQNMEELYATQEEMKRNEFVYKDKIFSLQNRLSSYESV